MMTTKIMNQKLSGTLQMVAIIYTTLDVIGWTMWALSGQLPATGYYLGKFTSLVINLFI